MKKLLSALGIVIAIFAVVVFADCAYRFLTTNCRKYICLHK